ncbi:MAG: alpha/beta fold hydrolase [Holophagaceae bacterium]
MSTGAVSTDLVAGLEPLLTESGERLEIHIAYRRTGFGPLRVLLLHALTGGPDAADRPTSDSVVKGWWSPLFAPGAPFDPARTTVWTPNLVGSCYGTTGPRPGRPFPALTPRDQAAALATWIRAEGLCFDVVLGGSLGGMVALELALLEPDRFHRVGVIGAGARADAWIRGINAAQAAVLRSPLPDAEAIALARQQAMLSFRAPESLDARFPDTGSIRGWLEHHGRALARRFTRESYLALLGAMDAHDVGRGRGGLVAGLRGLRGSLHVLGIHSDALFTPPLLRELADSARAAGVPTSLHWLRSPHGHDAFLIEWDQVDAWLRTHLLIQAAA